MKRELKLNFFSVSLMYVGTIMGAGFASGREIWQFFGVFGDKGKIGVLFVGALFVILGMMTSYISRRLNTNDMGRVIVPGGSKRLTALVGYFMALMLFTVLITMTAAGGALFNQQLGLSRIIGGMLIAVLVIVTVLGEFERVSKVFRYIMPVLFGIVVVLSLLVIFMPLEPSDVKASVKPSPIASNWALAALLYISYNILAVIPIVATASIKSKSEKSAVLGTGLGGGFLCLLAFLLLSALQTDMPFSQAMDMPMLGYSSRLSPIINTIYGIVLFCAIYSSATSNFYGFTTKIKDGPQKKRAIIIVVWIGFFLGLVGFKNVVAYMFPMEGFFGFIIIAMIIINFFKVWKDERHKKKMSEFLKNFEGHDRNAYPYPVFRVTGGTGGEALLIKGSEKTALYDLGMACFAPELIENIENILTEESRTIDYIFLSHTHYDHIGALPYVLKRWPDAKVCAAAKAVSVFKSKGAMDTMKRLGESAAKQFGHEDRPIMAEGNRVDIVMADKDEISLGDETMVAYETKGHTDCAMTYMLLPQKILFASESTGRLIGPGVIFNSPLKDVDETIRSAEKLKNLDISYLISPHYGAAPQSVNKTYFDSYIKSVEEERDMIISMKNAGKTYDEILEAHKEKYWSEERAMEHPYAAYHLNTEIVLNRILSGK